MDLQVEFLPWQEDAYNRSPNERFQVIAAGRRCGKSRYAAWRLILAALDPRPGKVWYVGMTQGNARDVMWDVLHDLAGPVIKGSHVNNLEITLINNKKISLKGSDRPDTLRGSSLKLLVMDEAAFMKPDTWETILRPSLSDMRGDAVFISTPEGRNWFYDLFCMAKLGDNPQWHAYELTTYDNPMIDPREIEEAKNTLSTMAFQQEYMASFNARESELFKEDWIEYGDEPEVGDYYIAIDLAGFQEAGRKKHKVDNSAIAVVKVNEDGWWVNEIRVGRWSFDETVRHIFHTVQKYNPVAVGIEKGIAKQAVMSPLTDMMRRHAKFFHIDELTHGNVNKANRIVAALQGRFEHGRIKLNKSDWNMQFIDELLNFPTPLVHDDMIDALSYIDQLARETYQDPDIFEEEEYILDTVAGY